MSKNHVFLDSLQVQILEHTHHSLGPVKYYVFLDSLRPQIREHTHCSLGLAALYYTGIELEKMKQTQGEHTYREQRKQLQRTL